MFPETVGRSLEEVEEIFKQGHTFTAWKIGKDVGKKTLAEVVEKSKEIPVRHYDTYVLFYGSLMPLRDSISMEKVQRALKSTPRSMLHNLTKIPLTMMKVYE